MDESLRLWFYITEEPTPFARDKTKRCVLRGVVAMDRAQPIAITIVAAALPPSDLPPWLVVLSWIAFGSALLYHVTWLLGRCIKNLPSLWKFVVLFFNPFRHYEAGELVRRALRTRLSTSLLSTSAQWLSMFRLGLIVGVMWRWARTRAFDPQWETDLIKPFGEPASIFLFSLTIAYAAFIHFARRSAEKSQSIVEMEERRMSKSGPPGLWFQRYPDVFFYPAMVDIFYLTLASLCLPGPNDMHLGFFVPVMAAWLFDNAGRTLILYICIVLSLTIHWYWTAWLVTSGGALDTAQINWTHYFWGTTLPRVVFWFFVCCLMMVMRALRRMAEEQAAFFRGLAEALPFEVFVKEKGKDNAIRFVFVTDKLVNKLRRIPGNEKLDLSSIQGKTDADLHIDQAKVDCYKAVDERVLAGEDFQDFEPTYAHNSDAEIETLKRAILNREDKPAYILGLCRDPLTEADQWFFLSLVAKQISFCFFRKRDGRFTWANKKFAQDAGKNSSTEIKGLMDSDLYERRYAEKYICDDQQVVITGELEEEEWHQPIGRAKRRVRVTKMRVSNSDGTADGVRGYFYDIHRSHILRVSVDAVVTRYVNSLLRGLELWKLKRDEGVDQCLRDDDIKKRAFEISQRPESRAFSDAMADWHQARAELRSEFVVKYRLIEGASVEDLLYGYRLLANAIRLLSLRERELTRVAFKDGNHIPDCYSDLTWVQGKSSLSRLFDQLKRVFRFWFPSVHFEFSATGLKDEWEGDPRWLEAVVAGLWFYTAELATLPNAPEVCKNIYTKASLEDLGGVPTLILSVTQQHPDGARLPLDMESASDFLIKGDGDSCMGLHLARRAGVLSRCQTECRLDEKEPPTRTFEFRFPRA
jgi:hypothetical protein